MPFVFGRNIRRLLLLTVLAIFAVSIVKSHPVGRLELSRDLTISEHRQPGSLIFDFNEYLTSMDHDRANSFTFIPDVDERLNAYILPYLDLKPRSGRLLLKGSLDHEDLCLEKRACICGTCAFTLKIFASGPTRHFFIIARLRVIDVNDNVPTFSFNRTIVHVSENAKVGTVIAKVPLAVDTNDNLPVHQIKLCMNFDPKVMYKLTPHSHGLSPFGLNRTVSHLELVLERQLDREVQGQHPLSLEACDKDSSKCTGTDILVIVKDVNDEPPKIMNCPTSVLEIYENYSTSIPLLELKARDPDVNDSVFWTMAEPGTLIASISSVGAVYLKPLIEFPEGDRQFMHIRVIAKDLSDHRSECTLNLSFVPDEGKLPKLDCVTPSTLFANSTHVVIDVDGWERGMTENVVCQIRPTQSRSGQARSRRWKIKETYPIAGISWYVASEKSGRHELRVKTDGKTKFARNQWLQLDMADEAVMKSQSDASIAEIRLYARFARRNWNSPKFVLPVYNASMLDDDVYVVQVNVTDEDIDDDITLFIPELNLAKTTMLRQTVRSVSVGLPPYRNDTLLMYAKDNGWPSRNSENAIIHYPSDLYCKFTKDLYNFLIEENQLRFGPIKLLRHSKTANIQYRLSPPHIPFQLGNDGFFTSSADLDRESKERYNFLVQALVKTYDKAANGSAVEYNGRERWTVCSETRVDLRLSDANDNPPVIIFPHPNERVRIRMTERCRNKCALMAVEVHDPDIGRNRQHKFELKMHTDTIAIRDDGTLVYVGRNVSRQTFKLLISVWNVDMASFNDSVEFTLDLLPPIDSYSMEANPNEHNGPRLLRTYTVEYSVAIICGLSLIVVILLSCLVYTGQRLQKRRTMSCCRNICVMDSKSKVIVGDHEILQGRDTARCAAITNQSENDSMSTNKTLLDAHTISPESTSSISDQISMSKKGYSASSTSPLLNAIKDGHQRPVRNGKASKDSPVVNMLQRQRDPLYSIPKWLSECDNNRSTII